MLQGFVSKLGISVPSPGVNKNKVRQKIRYLVSVKLSS